MKQIKIKPGWAAVLALAFILPAHAQHATVSCGTEGQRECRSTDWEYKSLRWNRESACDYDLKSVNGICVNNRRRQLPSTLGSNWQNWAIRQQIRFIGANTPINFLTWPGAHNSFSNENQGFQDNIISNHLLSITDQLTYGARHLELDPHYYRDEIRLCHSKNTTDCIGLNMENRHFALALKEIATWLDANPQEIIVIKLDDKIDNDQMPLLASMIESYLGHRVLQAPSGSGAIYPRWPTPAEFNGKQVIIFTHNGDAQRNKWFWDGKQHFLADNHPKKQNFTTCTDSAGYTPVTRPAMFWWDTAEGRSGSNATNLTKSNTGLYRPAAATNINGDDRRAADAAKCGVSIIGLDQLAALNYGVPLFHENLEDTRIAEAVWSWKQGDFGQAGPAMRDTSGRWSSRAQSELHHIACARKNGQTYTATRDWRITSGTYPWNQDTARIACETNFGTNFEFAVPVNGFQQLELNALAGTREVWINYSSAPVALMNVDTNDFPFNMTRGGAPATTSKSFVVNGTQTMNLQLELNNPPSWLTFTLAANAIPTVGGVTGEVSIIPSEAAKLPTGTYFHSATLRGTLSSGLNTSLPLEVWLYVNDASVTTLTSTHTSVPWNGTFTLTARVTAPTAISFGTVDLFEAVPLSQGGYTNQFLQMATLVNGTASFVRQAKLTPGTHLFIAKFRRAEGLDASESAALPVVVLPRAATPSSLTFTMTQGGAIPFSQSVTLQGIGTPNSNGGTGDCSWFSVEMVSDVAKVIPNQRASSRSIGTYNCAVYFKDTNTEIGGYFDVPVTLRVITDISVAPSVLNLVAAAGATSPRGTFSVTAGGNATIPITFKKTASWLLALPGQDSSVTPMPAALAIASPNGVAPGTYFDNIEVTSPNSDSVRRVRVNLTVVNATAVSTNPPGLPFTVDGETYTSRKLFAWPAGSTHSISVGAAITNNGTRNRFTGWVPNASTASFTYTALAAGGEVQASFATEYQLSANAVPSNGGSITIAPTSPDGFYSAGTLVSLTPNTNAGFTFVGWSGSLIGDRAARTLTMNEPKSTTATFTPVTSVNLIVSGTTGGVVNVNGNNYTLPATIPVTPNSTVIVTSQTPILTGNGTRIVFGSLAGGNVNPAGVAIGTTDRYIVADYRVQHLVSVSASPLSGGTVTGANWYDAGSTATVQAVANSGYVFNGFSGTTGLSGSTNPQQITVNAPVTATANFGPAGRPTLTASTAGARIYNGVTSVGVPISLTNIATAAASVDTQIVSITGLNVVGGTGTVAVTSTLPLQFGSLSPNATVTLPLEFNWPASATRIRFTVNYTANGGSYSGSTTLTIFR